MYKNIEKNKRRTWLLMLIFILLIAAIGYVFGETTGSGWFGLIIATIFAGVAAFFSYYYSDQIILKISKARPAKKEEYPHLVNSIEGLSLAAGMPQPKLYIIDDPAPNAFATGRNPEKGVVAVTTGLLERLNRVEVEGVIAHEMAHIKNYDTLIATLAAVMVGAVIILSDWLRRSFFYRSIGVGRSSSRSSSKGGGPQAVMMIVGLVLAILAPIFAQLLRLAISRRREFLADADGALLTRYPEGLASALEKISANNTKPQQANDATAPLYIINPFSRGKKSSMFSTHPATEERVKALRKM